MILTAKQKKAICAKYSAGGVSQRTLAIEYGVSEKTIYNVVKGDQNFSEKVGKAKKEAEEYAEASMLDFLCSRHEKAQTLIDKFMKLLCAYIR